MSVGEKIKNARIQKGITQKQLAEACNMKDTAIGRYERGRANPKIETLTKIARALEIDVYELMEIPFEAFNNSDDYKPHPNKDEILNDIYTSDLLNAFSCLNMAGKQCAVSQVQLVASVPEYRKKPDSSDTPQ